MVDELVACKTVRCRDVCGAYPGAAPGVLDLLPGGETLHHDADSGPSGTGDGSTATGGGRFLGAAGRVVGNGDGLHRVAAIRLLRTGMDGDGHLVEDCAHRLVILQLGVMQVGLHGAERAHTPDLLTTNDDRSFHHRRQLVNVNIMGLPASAVVDVDPVSIPVAAHLANRPPGRGENRRAVADIRVATV